MKKKIFRAFMKTVMIVLTVSLILSVGFLYAYYNRAQANRLKEELFLAQLGVENSGTDYFNDFQSSVFRFTLISNDGSVLYDSQAIPEKMENHIKRKEISEAIKNGSGSSTRYSSTLTKRTLYKAVRLSNGNVLRISTVQVTIGDLIIGMMPVICAIVLFCIFTVTVLSKRMTASIVKPLETLDLDNPKSNDTYDELAPLLSKLNKQQMQISRQIQELKQKSDEFEQITASMSEGLVLLDKNGLVISLNKAAEKFFSTDKSVIGCNFLTIDRSPDMSRAVEKSFSGKHSEFREQRNSSEYQFMITPTEADGKISGIVILCIDVTETAFAERNRREFTANVSHELKTPLQSIIGSAELLENGLVKSEDTDRFIGNIKNEAMRLVALINDIIRLSQLDENTELPTESVDLYEISDEVVSALHSAAEKKNVTVTLKGENCVIKGIRRYLYEIVYNLCDNAVRYNKTGGKVEISLKREESRALLTVSDTGIGIPPENRNRIFERFYRVDKSHSKETGGTGLGLSIVKHAVACHGGSIAVDSTVGKGTAITVTFNLI